MLITVYWPDRTGLLQNEGPYGSEEKTTTAMITHSGALDNTQSAVTAAGHLCYAPVSRLCQQISACHTQLQPLCVSAASVHNFLCTLYRNICSFKKKKKNIVDPHVEHSSIRMKLLTHSRNYPWHPLGENKPFKVCLSTITAPNWICQDWRMAVGRWMENMGELTQTMWLPNTQCLFIHVCKAFRWAQSSLATIGSILAARPWCFFALRQLCYGQNILHYLYP